MNDPRREIDEAVVCSCYQSVVPLEDREHAWLVKGAAGAWPDIYSLFREDSTLLNRRDFISGFTVLHWIAKHGDHRVLNTLWYAAKLSALSRPHAVKTGRSGLCSILRAVSLQREIV